MTTNSDRYPDFKHEDELINQRLTWLLQSQALLFAGYALILTSNNAQLLARPFLVVGIVTATIILVGIIAATIAIHYIWCDSKKDDDGNPIPNGSADWKPLGVRGWTTRMGLATALALPLVFIFGWIYVSVSAPEFRATSEPANVAPVDSKRTETREDPRSSQSFWPQFSVRFAAASAGFFVALLCNSIVGWFRIRRVYFSMLHAIQSEARSNETIRTESFEPFYQAPNDIVLRDYSLEVAANYVTNSVFIDYAPREYLDAIQKYIRTLRLGNLYRDKHEMVRFHSDYAEAVSNSQDAERRDAHRVLRKHDSDLVADLEKNIGQCKDAIAEVLALAEKARI